MVKLILVRHGESVANAKNQYTGWSDVLLTPRGRQQAKQVGQILLDNKITFAQVHTSLLQRAIVTALLIQEACHVNDVPLQKTWRLNERHYGALRGRDKDETRRQYGEQQVALWRRSFWSVPPQLANPDTKQRAYQRYPVSILPLAESLAQASLRTIPYFQDCVAPQLIDGKNQLIVAHGSTLRALIKYLENLSAQEIDGVEVQNAQPIVYTLDNKLSITAKDILN